MPSMSKENYKVNYKTRIQDVVDYYPSRIPGDLQVTIIIRCDFLWPGIIWKLFFSALRIKIVVDCERKQQQSDTHH